MNQLFSTMPNSTLRRSRPRRRGFTWTHLYAFLTLDLAMAALLCYVLFSIAAYQLDIPETEAIDEHALGAALAALPAPALSAEEDDDAPVAPAVVATAPTPTYTPVLKGGIPPPADTPTPTPTATRPRPTNTPRPTATPSPTRAPLPAGSLPSLAKPEQLANWPQTLNIVLLGSDRRGTSGVGRTDTIIIVAIDPEGKRAAVVTIPRDLWIELPNYANRINTLDVVGGTKLLKQVLQVKLGIPIHYYARIDFGGFVKAVDALGGITVDVECRVAEAGWIDIPAGPVKMDGTMALAFSRTRHTTSDFDRMRRQQAVLLAIRKKLLSPDVLPRLPEVVKQLVAMTDTDIPPQTILALTKLGAEIDLKNVRGFLIDESKVRSWRTSSGAQVLLPDQAKIQAGVQNIWTGQPLTDAIKRPRSCK